MRVAVWRKPEYSGEFVVNADGTINHPFYQTVRVVGMPLAAVKDTLQAFVGRFEHNPLLTIEPLFRVTVGGEVRAPNVYSMPRATTIAQAIALAGGSSERGNLRKIQLYREGAEQRLDLTNPGTGDATMPIVSGDYIVVGRAGNFFRDIIGPFATITAAVASIVVVVRQE